MGRSEWNRLEYNIAFTLVTMVFFVACILTLSYNVETYVPLWPDNVNSGTFTMATEGEGSEETGGSTSSSEIQRSSPDESCL